MMKKYKALAFDVGGSVFNWKEAVRVAVDAEARRQGVEIDSETFAMDWRRQLFIRLGQVRRGELEYQNVDSILATALTDISVGHPSLSLTGDAKLSLQNAWHQMTAFEDFPPALEKLKQDHTVVVLTILSFAIVVDSSKHSGITWDGIISCEFLDHYKPDAGAYLEGCSLLRLKPAEVCMVAVHPTDLLAASKAGMGMAMVEPQLQEPDIPGLTLAEPPDARVYDYHAENFASLVDQMCPPPG